jgi:hypothetical protein
VRTKNADVCTGDLVVWQQKNQMRVFLLQLNWNACQLIASKHGIVWLRLAIVNAPFNFSLIKMYADWLCQNMVSICNFGLVAKIMYRLCKRALIDAVPWKQSGMQCLAGVLGLQLRWGMCFYVGGLFMRFPHEAPWLLPLCTFLEFSIMFIAFHAP